MNLVLVSIGLLLITTMVTLLLAGPRTWVVAMAHGLGLQAVIGIIVSAIQVGWIHEGTERLPIEERVVLAVEGIPANAAGWTAASIFGALTNDAHDGVMSDLDAYVMVAGAQMLLVAAVIAARKLREEQIVDPVVVILFGLLITNSACNAVWPWWGN